MGEGNLAGDGGGLAVGCRMLSHRVFPVEIGGLIKGFK